MVRNVRLFADCFQLTLQIISDALESFYFLLQINHEVFHSFTSVADVCLRFGCGDSCLMSGLQFVLLFIVGSVLIQVWITIIQLIRFITWSSTSKTVQVSFLRFKLRCICHYKRHVSFTISVTYIAWSVGNWFRWNLCCYCSCHHQPVMSCCKLAMRTDYQSRSWSQSSFHWQACQRKYCCVLPTSFVEVAGLR